MSLKYAMSTLKGAKVVRGKVQHELSCGHDYYSQPLYGESPQLHRNAVMAHINRQERCKKCER